MEIITGYTGKPHVTAEQDRDVNEGIFDTGSFVLKLAHSWQQNWYQITKSKSEMEYW